MAEKDRLDIVLVKNNLISSRELAKSIIMMGKVYIDGIKEDKPGTKVSLHAEIFIKDYEQKYVSRGGFKLEKAMSTFPIVLQDKICLDIGASTGGFTDCMLQNGAKKVYAIDVGYGQLAWKLRQDERVICMEKTNIRGVTIADLQDRSDFASIDVSFISLTKVLSPVCALLHEDGELVCLIKPQFEAGRNQVGKKGVVKDPLVHKEVLTTVTNYACSLNLQVHGISFSPIKGPEGNIEYLTYLHKSKEGLPEEARILLIQKIVSEAHGTL